MKLRQWWLSHIKAEHDPLTVTPYCSEGDGQDSRQALAEAIVDRLPGAVYCLSRNSKTLCFLSQGANVLLNGQTQALHQRAGFEMLVHPEDREHWHQTLAALSEDNQRYEILYRLAPGLGWHRPITWVLDRGVLRRRASGDTLEGVLLDMTGHQRRQQHLAHAAEHDAITGFLHRLPFLEYLENATREQEPGALLYFDIVRYSAINYSLGYQAGDSLLKQVAERIRACVSTDAMLTRLSADEFAVYLPDAERRHGVLARLMATLKPEYWLGRQSVTVDITAGVATDTHKGADALLRHARLALQHARAHNRLHAEYSVGLYEEDSAPLKLEQALRCALMRDELSMFYQAQVSAEDGRVIGAESLMRWYHDTLGEISPERFIPLAEELGLIAELGRWSLATVCEQIAEWDDKGIIVPRVSVNVSTLQLTSTLVDQVAILLARFDLTPDRLELEVTETQLIRDLTVSHHVLEALRAKGVAIALDDFGTGYSSLAYLASLPIDRLKIDKRFVDGVPERTPERGVIKAVISMAHALSLEVIVEGVETEQQWQYLREQDCHVLQGYYFGTPVDAQTFATRLVSPKG
ncbi:putative bifunctional diguanylate cyclase/phosphodiesterase [Larsenimonas suaedae]|uniref:EAL domain-containing protein n=1 Tax=Larsenimonas suaedae TaxID=1851019 RepID=A0ABU1GX21_9GAMM|nr:GGDEF domain-containing phosphodiesterase [Larsenimonas suaedae]MCM2973107.1 EAL domain-containing protein [Larsenimonas suaedae]MDR5896544.1 EAL domain-containing protein [Larsenimonas suaedae]